VRHILWDSRIFLKDKYIKMYHEHGVHGFSRMNNSTDFRSQVDAFRERCLSLLATLRGLRLTLFPTESVRSERKSMEYLGY